MLQLLGAQIHPTGIGRAVVPPMRSVRRPRALPRHDKGSCRASVVSPARCRSGMHVMSSIDLSDSLLATQPAARQDDVMPLPPPRFRRVAALVAIDRGERVALVTSLETSAVASGLPWREVKPGESYVEAVTALGRELLGERGLRLGPVMGRRWAPLPQNNNHRRTEQHYFILRVDGEAAACADHVSWVPRTGLGTCLADRFLDDAVILVDGYLDGWLPDGPVTLE